MTSRSEILRRTGEALYGERWQSRLSRDLGVTDRTVRNWAAERTDCPEYIPKRLLELLEIRSGDVGSLMILIENHIASQEVDPTDYHAEKQH